MISAFSITTALARALILARNASLSDTKSLIVREPTYGRIIVSRVGKFCIAVFVHLPDSTSVRAVASSQLCRRCLELRRSRNCLAIVPN